ncbi:alanine racemase [Nocardia barduliensis]|uniref:alanine racemase n=1 Tax=Nocardia barduliensis TaxID=2736643 RepID=UPI0028A8F2A9|nr:alanine racemase [Nocardia barduliensis]
MGPRRKDCPLAGDGGRGGLRASERNRRPMSTATNPRTRLGASAEWPAIRQALDLLAIPGSRHAIPTPAAIIDLAALRGNLERAAEICRDAGVALRPHAKTHKSADLARLQLAAGAVDICVAKVGEAEALFSAGIDDILVTSPIVAAGHGADLIRPQCCRRDGPGGHWHHPGHDLCRRATFEVQMQTCRVGVVAGFTSASGSSASSAEMRFRGSRPSGGRNTSFRSIVGPRHRPQPSRTVCVRGNRLGRNTSSNMSG